MNKFSPKPDLWSKIQQRKDFDSQMKEHIPNLPVKMPKADLWSAIESELDQKTPIIPLWKYGIAASVALILALASFTYLQVWEKETEKTLITEISIPAAEIETIDIKAKTDKKPEELKPGEIKPDTHLKVTPRRYSTQREIIKAIEPPQLNLADLSVENTFVSDLIIPPTPVVEAPKTLHQVSISWNKIKPKMQITTGFGGHESDLDQKQQASTEQKAQVTLEINN